MTSNSRSAHLPDQPAMLYGAGSIAAYLGMTEHACRHLISEGIIPTFKVGSRIAARRESIDAWLCEQEARAKAGAIRPVLRVLEESPRRPRRALRRIYPDSPDEPNVW